MSITKLFADNHNRRFYASMNEVRIYIYISRVYKDAEDLKGYLDVNRVKTEYDCLKFLEKAAENIEVTEDDFKAIATGRRMYARACRNLLPKSVEERIFDVIDLDTAYILYNDDGSIKWVYVDEEIPNVDFDVPISVFPDMFKALLSEKLREVHRPIENAEEDIDDNGRTVYPVSEMAVVENK